MSRCATPIKTIPTRGFDLLASGINYLIDGIDTRAGEMNVEEWRLQLSKMMKTDGYGKCKRDRQTMLLIQG